MRCPFVDVVDDTQQNPWPVLARDGHRPRTGLQAGRGFCIPQKVRLGHKGGRGAVTPRPLSRNPVEVRPMTDRICSVDGCEQSAERRGWCYMHYRRWRVEGTPGEAANRRSVTKGDMWSKVDRNGPGGCWIWTASTDQKGYGRITRNNRKHSAHRYMYKLLVGPIPDGLELDHLCRVTSCVNPAHLEPVTTRENLRRSTAASTLNALKTHCPAGHEYTPENTYCPPSRPTWRSCRTCIRAKGRGRRKAAPTPGVE